MSSCSISPSCSLRSICESSVKFSVNASSSIISRLWLASRSINLAFFFSLMLSQGLILIWNVNVVPNPNFETTLMSPPSYSQILLHIERPTPLLTDCLLDYLLILLNGSKAFYAASSLIPNPLSLTVISRKVSLPEPLQMFEKTLMIPVSWNFVALLSKFRMTC